MSNCICSFHFQDWSLVSLLYRPTRCVDRYWQLGNQNEKCAAWQQCLHKGNLHMWPSQLQSALSSVDAAAVSHLAYGDCQERKQCLFTAFVDDAEIRSSINALIKHRVRGMYAWCINHAAAACIGLLNCVGRCSDVNSRIRLSYFIQRLLFAMNNCKIGQALTFLLTTDHKQVLFKPHRQMSDVRHACSCSRFHMQTELPSARLAQGAAAVEFRELVFEKQPTAEYLIESYWAAAAAW